MQLVSHAVRCALFALMNLSILFNFFLLPTLGLKIQLETRTTFWPNQMQKKPFFVSSFFSTRTTNVNNNKYINNW